MKPTRRHVVGSLVTLAGVWLSSGNAGADDALDELKVGYALKQAGRCADAIPHFMRSFQLHHEPKAILNLADCEARTGDLLGARDHAAQGRDLAVQEDDAKLQSVAADQIADVDRRLPRLTIRLAVRPPPGCSVALDGRLIEPSSLGIEFAVNPGAHHVVTSAPLFTDRGYDFDMVEGERQQLEVQPGIRTAGSDVAAVRVPTPGLSTKDQGDGDRQALRTLGFVSLGTGAVALTIGVAFGLTALSKNSTLEGECEDRQCPPTAQGEIDSFNRARVASDIAYAAGFVGLGGGSILWLLSRSSGAQKPEAHVWIGPTTVGMDGAF